MCDLDQGVLEFPIDRRPMPARPWVVLRLEGDGVSAHWPDFGLAARFPDWPAALAAVLHPLNDHVRVRVVA